MSRYRRLLLLTLGLLVDTVIVGRALRPQLSTSGPPNARPPGLPSPAPALLSPDGPVPAAIHTTVHRGRIAVTVVVTPVDVGPVRFVVSVTDRGRRVTAGRVGIDLSMPTQPVFGRALLDTVPCAAGYCSRGTLQALGRWHFVVLVRLPERSGGPLRFPFDVLNGANARFLFAQPPDTRFGPATVRLARAPDGSSILRIRLRPHLAVRAVLDMPNMRSMGSAMYAAVAQPQGWYAVSLAFPMAGVTQVVLAVRVGRT